MCGAPTAPPWPPPAGRSTSLPSSLCSSQPSFLTGLTARSVGRSVHWPFKCTLGGREEREGEKEGGRGFLGENVRTERRPPPVVLRLRQAAGAGRRGGRRVRKGREGGRKEGRRELFNGSPPPSLPLRVQLGWNRRAQENPGQPFSNGFSNRQRGRTRAICETGQI